MPVTVVPGSTDRSLDRRIGEHRRLSGTLAAHRDSELASLIAARREGVVGIGGAATRIDIEGIPVFVKRLPLTDRERRPAAAGSTANVFGLPAHCHYGVGSPGFGAWRELAATRTTTNWVLSGHSESFPLLHHWRILPGGTPTTDELHDIEASVAYWGGHPAMRDRLHALATASASLVLFLEHIPSTVARWLADQTAGGERTARAAATMLETQLLDGAAFMTAHGMVHFDAHFDNVLTDGHRLYFADFGLAATSDFALSTDEAALVERARTHDVAYAITRLVNWAVSTFGNPSCAIDPVVRNDYVRACGQDAEHTPLPEPAAAILQRYAPTAAIMNDFYAELFTVRRDAPYPAEAVSTELARLSAADLLPRALTGLRAKESARLSRGRRG